MTLIEHPPERSEMLEVVQSWDTAIKDTPNCDFSVCTTWCWRDRWYLLDVFRMRSTVRQPHLQAGASMTSISSSGRSRRAVAASESRPSGCQNAEVSLLNGHTKRGGRSRTTRIAGPLW
jgi:phage terminase large subunit-like protein